MDIVAERALERATLVYPHPIAVATGRILRARTLPEKLDAVQRAGEALSRYTAALALASFAARTDPSLPVPKGLADFDGNLSWGHFLAICDLISALPDGTHPLAQQLKSGFQPGKNGEPGPATVLATMLQIRNQYGHDLQAIGNAQAEVIFGKAQPDRLLVAALDGLNRLMELPIFLLDDQRLARGSVHARRLQLMGESDNPRSDEITLNADLYETGRLYLGTPQGALNLWPWLLWDLADRRVTYAVFVIHGINKQIAYRSMFGDELERNSSLQSAIVQRRNGALVPLESVGFADGRSFVMEWATERRLREQTLAERGAPVLWHQLDESTLQWYIGRLGASGSSGDRQEILQTVLLDKRDVLRPDEIKQLVLLFGTDEAVTQLLSREMLDLRVFSDPSKRWDERRSLTRNVIQSLREAVQFFGKYVGVDDVTLDGLQATFGSADYIAMREALVNLFIHQDYNDNHTVAQIEIKPEQTMMFNAGKSLVSKESLVDGGKSQARNPLIARALRLIGFAELAGSGLRALQQHWREEHRRPPRFESSSSANTFTLILDWRKVPVITDDFWRSRLGVRLSPQQAKVLSLLAEPTPFTAEEIASGTGVLLDDLKRDLGYLELQTLVVKENGKWLLREDLRQLVTSQEAKNESDS